MLWVKRCSEKTCHLNSGALIFGKDSVEDAFELVIGD